MSHQVDKSMNSGDINLDTVSRRKKVSIIPRPFSVHLCSRPQAVQSKCCLNIVSFTMYFNLSKGFTSPEY